MWRAENRKDLSQNFEDFIIPTYLKVSSFYFHN